MTVLGPGGVEGQGDGVKGQGDGVTDKGDKGESRCRRRGKESGKRKGGDWKTDGDERERDRQR